MATEVGVRELKHRLRHCLGRVAAGEIMTITNRGRPVARLTPVGQAEGDDFLRLAAAGAVQWGGRKPRLRGKGPRVKGPVSLAQIVSDQRR